MRFSKEAQRLIAAAEAHARAMRQLRRSAVTQALRDRLDAITRRINAASAKNLFGFETRE